MTQGDTRHRLSKSKVAVFEHCAKRLWLQVHRRDLARVDARTLDLFRWGHRVGDLARAQSPAGMMVDADPDIAAALARTRELIDGGWNQPIFEATFQHQDVLIRADILEPDGRRGWRLVEVKNSERVQSYQFGDVTTQAWTAIGQGVRLSAFVIRHVRHKVRQEADLAECTFIDTDITWRVIGLLPRRPAIIKAARTCVEGPEPMRKPGPHCTRPFVCEFRDYCAAGTGRQLEELRQMRENGSQESQ
jgi:hypothetical protein